MAEPQSSVWNVTGDRNDKNAQYSIPRGIIQVNRLLSEDKTNKTKHKKKKT